MPLIPIHIHILFIATALLTAVLMVTSILKSGNEKVRRLGHIISLIVLMWLIFLAALAINKYFLNTTALPPKILVPVIMCLAVILIMFILPRGKRFIDGLPLTGLTWIHIVRFPVEITLYWLALEKMVPRSMTFEGTNFDIIMGISAPIIAILYTKNKIGKITMITWNILGIILLMNIVINAALSVPSLIQQINFDQPNWAVLHFPYVWLPGFIVPVVLFSHLASLRLLTRKEARVSV